MKNNIKKVYIINYLKKSQEKEIKIQFILFYKNNN